MAFVWVSLLVCFVCVFAWLACGAGRLASLPVAGPLLSRWARCATHVFFQRVSFLTVDFNTSLVVYLTNIPTLESFPVDPVFPGILFPRLVGAANFSRGSQL